MRPVIAIRTHRWTEEEDRLLAALREVQGHDLAVVFHNRPDGTTPPLDIVDIDDGWVRRNGLRVLPDWGWRCGDFFYYALRAARPGHDHYWLIEPDVHFTAAPDGFFARFLDIEADALGYDIAPFAEPIAFARGLPDLPLHRAIYALTRLSGRAIDRLFAARQAYSATRVGPRLYTNDELFTFSHVAADPALTVRRLEDVAPDWFEGVQFATNPDILLDLLAQAPRSGRLYHPVHGRSSFKRAVAARLSPRSGFLRNVRAGLRQLEPAELREIAETAAARLLADLRHWHSGGTAAEEDGA